MEQGANVTVDKNYLLYLLLKFVSKFMCLCVSLKDALINRLKQRLTDLGQPFEEAVKEVFSS